MTVDQVIENYRNTQYIPRECHLNWLKENINPILKNIDPSISINWACSNCVSNHMNMLIGWKDRQKEIMKPKKKKKKKPTK